MSRRYLGVVSLERFQAVERYHLQALGRMPGVNVAVVHVPPRRSPVAARGIPASGDARRRPALRS
jgi:hypothetical protein